MRDNKYFRFMRAVNAFAADDCESCPVKSDCHALTETVGSCEQILFYYVEHGEFPPKDFFKNVPRNYWQMIKVVI